MSDFVIKLIDRYIEERKKKGYWLMPLSRPKVIELFVLDNLDRAGLLERFLEEFGMEASEVDSIKAHLQAERQAVSKQPQSKK